MDLTPGERVCMLDEDRAGTVLKVQEEVFWWNGTMDLISGGSFRSGEGEWFYRPCSDRFPRGLR